MFGYLTAYKDQLSEEDKRIYQGYYCGLCENLKQKFGVKSELILAYDPVFIAILYTALFENEESIRDSLCLWKATKVPRVSTDALSYAADMNLLLSYNNYKDQAHDSASKRAMQAIRFLKKDYQKTCETYPRQTEAVEKYLGELQLYEKAPDENPDHAANLTGEMLSEVFLLKEDEFTRYLKPMLFYLGKYIYLADAFVDVEKDLKSGSYNPYAQWFESLDPETFETRTMEHMESVMGECARYYERLPIIQHKELLNNVIYSGVWLAVGKAKNERRKVREAKPQA